MRNIIPFEKYQGLGNDFILLDYYTHPRLPTPTTDFIRKVCDRHYGIGADGVLLFTSQFPTERGEMPAVRMIYFNADGSRAETCFNGLRCIALHAVRAEAVGRGEELLIKTDADDVHAMVDVVADTVQTTIPSTPIVREQTLTIDEGRLSGQVVSLGNPHFVVWTEGKDIDELNRMTQRIGPKIETAPAFANGTNFELAAKGSEGKIKMAVWERGVGMTLACGSGATATVCAGVSAGLLPAGTAVTVQMAGGDLAITKTDDRVTIRGPAKHVFSGVVDPILFF